MFYTVKELFILKVKRFLYCVSCLIVCYAFIAAFFAVAILFN